MEIVIKIDEKDYNLAYDLISGVEPKFCRDRIYKAIAIGTVLPKGHGRLIDADKLDTGERGNNSQRTMWWNIDCIVKDAETIVEADKG